MTGPSGLLPKPGEWTRSCLVMRGSPRLGNLSRVKSGTLRGWCQQAEIKDGKRPGIMTTESQCGKALDAEVRELKGANLIMLAVSSFFARELDLFLPW